MPCWKPWLTAVGGIPEIVEDGKSALLVPSGNVGALADAMGRVLTEPDLVSRLVANAHTVIQQRHSPELRVERLMDLYNSLKDGGRA
jgi:glycosyltransferase involved in cell wall biosynthesis